MNKLIVLSYNIHKGLSSGIGATTLHLMRDEIRRVHPDLVFVQEVHGLEPSRSRRRIPSHRHNGSQFEYLAHEIWPHFAYGKNAAYSRGHHGNAILSKYPILKSNNIDLSENRLERRGLLHAAVTVPWLKVPLDAFCTHLNLLEHHRRRQLQRVIKNLRSTVSKKNPLILAGDFNDWRCSANSMLKKSLDLDEVFLQLQGQNAKTFPGIHPVLRLDRIYYRGINLAAAHRLTRGRWRVLSDHVPIVAEFLPT